MKTLIFFYIKAGVLQGDTLAPYLIVICLDYMLRISADAQKDLGLTHVKARSRRYPKQKITEADDLALFSDTIADAIHPCSTTSKMQLKRSGYM